MRRTMMGRWRGRFFLGLRVAAFSVAAALLVPSSDVLAEPATSPSALRSIEIDTRRGTWMSVDVSPDGETLVFDLLGDIYRMPRGGGEAKRLTTARVESEAAKSARGPAMDVQPRFSPSGERIAFVSDRSGTENLWVMDADGADPRRVSAAKGAGIHSPAWSPDGERIVVRRSASIRSGRLWAFSLSEGPSPGRALADADRLVDAQGPVFAPDGESVYFAAPFGAGEKRPLRRETWQIGRLELDTGDLEQVTDRANGAVRPRVAPDGGTLAYGTWSEGEPALVARDLGAGAERVVYRGIERNLQDMYLAQLDLLPGYAFAPRGGSVVASFDGRIHAVDLEAGTSEPIPMRVRTTLRLPERPAVRAAFGEHVAARMARWPDVDRANGRVVFEAMGRIWARELDAPDAAARPISPAKWHAAQPALAPDGKTIAFVAVRDGKPGRAVYEMPAGGGEPTRLSRGGGDFAAPRFSPDGKRIAVVHHAAQKRGIGRRSIGEKAIGWIPADGGAMRTLAKARVSDAGARFAPDGEALLYTAEGELRSVPLGGGNSQVRAKAAGARRIVPSPDGAKAAIARDNRIAVRKLGEKGKRAATRPSEGPAPYAETAGVAGHFPVWLDQRRLAWSFGGKLHRASVDPETGELDTGAGAPEPVRLNARLPVEHPPADRALALRGARILPMDGSGAIPEGTVVVRGRRIAAVGPSKEIAVPDGARVIELGGRTVIPGLIDTHQHALAWLGADALRNLPVSFGPVRALLAYGVTTTRDPALIENVRDFAMIELLNSGRARGPRYTATGERIRPRDYRVETGADADRAIAAQKRMGATYIKEYLQPRRAQRQLLAAAARRSPIAITFEGGFDYKTLLSGVLDGYTGTEHSAGNHAVYGDFTQLVAKTGTFYVPTILSQIGAAHYYGRTEIAANEKLARFLSKRALKALEARRLRGEGVPDAETAFGPLTANAARLIEAGAVVGVGAHDRPAPTGLGTHWETWSFVEGGASPRAALRAATRHGARILGVADQVGTLEAGKLADLVVLRESPLADIRHTRTIERVMRDGFLYDGDTLERQWPE